MQGTFISELEWAPFKYLFWNANDSIVKLIVSITSGASLWCRPFYKNMLKSDFKKIAFICFNYSPSKMMKNAFYFVRKIFKFLSWLLGI